MMDSERSIGHVWRRHPAVVVLGTLLVTVSLGYVWSLSHTVGELSVVQQAFWRANERGETLEARLAEARASIDYMGREADKFKAQYTVAARQRDAARLLYTKMWSPNKQLEFDVERMTDDVYVVTAESRDIGEWDMAMSEFADAVYKELSADVETGGWPTAVSIQGPVLEFSGKWCRIQIRSASERPASGGEVWPFNVDLDILRLEGNKSIDSLRFIGWFRDEPALWHDTASGIQRRVKAVLAKVRAAPK